MNAFVCKTPGMVLDGVELVEVNNVHGQHYWKATQPIGNLFGQEVHGELEAIGTTKEQALEHLEQERKKLYESSR